MNRGPAVIAGCFGKLPAFGDFIRQGALPVADLVDRWFLGGGMDQGRHGDLVAAFAAAPPAFVLTQHADRWWGMVVVPSTDKVGRHSPFVVAVGVSALAVDDEAGVLPILFAPFFQAAYLQHHAGWPARIDDLNAVVQRLAATIDLDNAGDALVAALEGTSPAQLWQDLLGRADHPGRSAAMALAAALPPPGLRISPLSHQIHLSFWLMLIQLSANGQPPALVSMHPAGPGRTGRALVLTGRPRDEQCFAALWPDAAPQSYLAGVTDLATAAAHAPAGSGYTDVVVATARGEGAGTLRDLLYSAISLHRSTTRHRAPGR